MELYRFTPMFFTMLIILFSLRFNKLNRKVISFIVFVSFLFNFIFRYYPQNDKVEGMNNIGCLYYISSSLLIATLMSVIVYLNDLIRRTINK